MRSPYDTTVPLGAHAVESTLGLCLQLYCLALDLLVEDGTGVGILSRLLFVMCLAAFPVRGDHAVLRLIIIGWLTHLHEFCYGFCE